MSALYSQHDLKRASFKKETCSNVSILSKIYPLSAELSRQVLIENALEKPTQHVFLHLSYYLVCIVDPNKSAGLTWPLYDTKAERAYRTDFANFVAHYGKLGLLTPVMSSYFVNPGCYKVVTLMFQLSQLAVQKALKLKMSRESQMALYEDMTTKLKVSNNEDFFSNVEKETNIMHNNFYSYQRRKQMLEDVAAEFRKKITENTGKLSKVQKDVSDLIDNFLKKHNFENDIKEEIIKIKDVTQPVQLFDIWLEQTDITIDSFEAKWNENVRNVLDIAKTAQESSEALILRQTGETDKKSFTVEYNHATDEINTKELEIQVNSQQKYILKNIVRDQRLNFPNLVRGYVISLGYILRNADLSDDIFKFNEYLETAKRNYGEIMTALKILINRVVIAEGKLQPQPTCLFNHSVSMKEFSEIPPLPDLSDLKASREISLHSGFDSFTPLNLSKHQFNLRRRANQSSFTKPQPKSLITPFHHAPRDDFLKTLISCRVSTYDKPNMTQNISIISQAANRVNETIAECSSGFTKQQLQRLLSTKKVGSSTKKHKFSKERPNINVKKGGLFNESSDTALFRSHSSPNLYENRDKKRNRQQLSVMKEDIPALLEVSGISIIENVSEGNNTPRLLNLEDSSKLNAELPIISPIPNITVSPAPIITISPINSLETKFNKVLKETEADVNQELKTLKQEREILKERPQNRFLNEEKSKEETFLTPKPNNQSTKKISSIEKLLNRYKKVRAHVLSSSQNESGKDIQTIVEEKENNINTVNIDVFTVNRMLLPDLLSPSCSVIPKKSTEILDEICFDMDENDFASNRKGRESLGTALGVDQTILDQFDLID